MLKSTLIFISLLSSSLVFCQIDFSSLSKEKEFNFVPNPSFEETVSVPCYWNQGGDDLSKWLIDWSSPTETTPDLFSTKAKSTCYTHPKKHNKGKQYPHTGANMMGIKIYGLGGTDTYWHEYLQIPLKETLKKDSLYYVSIWVSVSARASKAANNMGVALMNEAIDTRKRLPLYITPVINQDKIIKPRIVGWKKVKGVFKAAGDEKYLLIGNFYGDESTLTQRIPGGKDGAYYYIDDVLLRRARPEEKESEKPKESLAPPPPEVVSGRIKSDEVVINKVEYETGSTVELKNIFFEFDKATILPESEKELKKLRNLLFDYPHMEIEISGHTDNVGQSDYNKKLSEKRAEAVYQYLADNDIEDNRLTFKGYGDSNPVSSNDTEVGREMNRRVEFKIIKQ